MTGAIIILVILILAGVILRYADKKKRPDEEARANDNGKKYDAVADDSGDKQEEQCCGQHIICEKTSLSPAFSEEIQYFDDEELDRFIGRSPDSYTSDEIEEFRDVLVTMRPDEVPAWARSLQLRQIPIPPSIRDEILLIASEL